MFRNRRISVLLMIFALIFCFSIAGSASAVSVPVANFTSNVTNGSAPLTVQYTDTSAGSPTSWNWNFGDGQSSTVENPTHTYSEVGNYNVTLNVTNSAGSSSLTQNNYVSTGSSVITNNNGIDIYVANSAGVKYNMPNGVTTAAQYNGVYPYVPNTYYIAEGGGGTNPIQLSTDPTNKVGQFTTTTNQTGTFYVVFSGGIGHLDDGILMLAVNGTLPSDFSVTLQSSGYTYTLPAPAITNPSTSSLTNITYVNDALNETFNSSDFIYGTQSWKPANTANYPIFNGENMTSASSQFHLMFIDLDVGGFVTNAIANEINDGSITVHYTFNNLPSTSFASFGAYGWFSACNWGTGIPQYSNSAQDGFNVEGVQTTSIPIANFTATPNTESVPLNVQFNDTSSNNPTSWYWTFGDGGSSTQQNPTYTYGTPGTYTVSLTAGNSAGNNTMTSQITVNYPAPVANFTENTTNGTAPLNVQFTDTSIGNVTSYYWTFGDNGTSTLQNPSYTYQTPGTYTVTETVTGPGGNNTATQTNLITVFNSSPPNVTATPGSGTYNSTQNVVLTSDQPGSTIYYTTDGSNPENSPTSVPYSAPIPISSTTDLQFAAVNQGGVWSTRYNNTYTILQQVVYVSPTGSDTTGTGTAANPYATIQNGLNNLAAGGTLNLMPGTYTGIGNSAITIVQNVNIIGENQNNTLINAANSNNIFNINTGVNVTIANLNLENGTASSLGGSIYCNYGSLTITNCTFTGNIAGQNGGAVYSTNNYLVVNNCSFVNNSPSTHDNGMAIYTSRATVIVNNCNFTNNKCYGGSGSTLTCYYSVSVTVTNCTFTNSTNATAIYIYSYNTTKTSTLINVNNCTFTNNSGPSNTSPGAIYDYNVVMNVSNCAFINNVALEYGGAIYNSYGLMNVTNCTFIGNNQTSTSSSSYGGGAISISTTSSTSGMNINNCSFINNTGNSGGAIFDSYGTFAGVVNNCTFINNTANNGGAIYDKVSNFIVNYSSFVNNTATTSGNIIYSSSSVNAENNWWGSNNSPASQIIGTVDYSNWLYMTETINQTSIVNGSTATVTVSFNNIWNGTNVVSINPANGNIPDGTAVNFSSILGTFNPTTTVTTSGIATTTFTATNIGSDFINATTNNQTVSAGTTVYIPIPTANFTANTTSGADPLNVQFTDTSSNNPTSWLWNFGDGGSSTLQNPTYTYTTPGKYTVSLTATNSYGNNTITMNNLINVIGPVIDTTTGLSYNNITSAVNDINTNNGDTITVAAGNYTENVVLNKTLTLEALGVVNVNPLGATQPVFTINSNGCTIEGFNISGSDDSGIYVNNATGNTITNNTILGNGTMTWGICILNSNGTNSITNNVVNNCTEGINLYNVDGATITNNAATDNEYDGIALTNSNDNTITNNNGTTQNVSGIRLNSSNDNTVANNNLTGNIWTSISLVTSQFNQITNNTASNDQEGMYLYSSDNNTITGNTANNNTWDGIAVANSNNNTIQNNDNVTNNNSGIRIIGTSSGNHVLNNVVTGNVWADMSLDTAGNTTISGNTFTNSEEGIFIYNSNGNTLTNNTMNNDIWDGIYIGNSDNNTLTSNSMSNGGYGVRIQGSTGNSIIANNFVNNYDQAYDNGSNETWNNSTTGNYYNDWNSTNPRPVDGGSNIDQYPTTTTN